MPHAPPLPLVDRLTAAPRVLDSARAARELAALTALAAPEPELAPLPALLAEPRVSELLAGIFSASPYLTRLIVRYPGYLLRKRYESLNEIRLLKSILPEITGKDFFWR